MNAREWAREKLSQFRLGNWLQLASMVVLGVLVYLGLTLTRKDPERRPPSEQGTPVRTLVVKKQTVTPRAVGYGEVKAQREWEMVAQVSGRVLEMHELMKVGSIIPEGTKLLRIDPQDYAIAATRQAAGVESARAQVSQLDAQEKSAKANLAIEQRSLELVQRDLDRTRELYASGNATQSDLDAAERAVLTQQKAVQSLQNTLAEIPANRRLLAAQIKESKAGLDTAQLDINRTQLEAPFDMRIRSLSIQPREVVSAGQVLAEADGLDAVEIAAQLSIGAVRPLVPFNPERRREPLTVDAIKRLPEILGMRATVHLKSEGEVRSREAKLDRFTAIDSSTRTMGIVVVVENPMDVKSKKEAGLVTGMYVEVELEGRPREGCVMVPRSALHDNTVFLLGSDSRLVSREVEIGIRQAEYVCVDKGVKEGETVVLTNLSPAIEGMLLDPRPDEATEKELAELASAKGDTK